MSDNENLLLKTNLKQLRLPTMKAEYDKLAQEASSGKLACLIRFLRALADLADTSSSVNRNKYCWKVAFSEEAS